MVTVRTADLTIDEAFDRTRVIAAVPIELVRKLPWRAEVDCDEGVISGERLTEMHDELHWRVMRLASREVSA